MLIRKANISNILLCSWLRLKHFMGRFQIRLEVKSPIFLQLLILNVKWAILGYFCKELQTVVVHKTQTDAWIRKRKPEVRLSLLEHQPYLLNLCQVPHLSNFSLTQLMENDDNRLNSSSRFLRKGESSLSDKNNNIDDKAVTVEMLRKLQEMAEKTTTNNTLVAVDSSMRKSASFQNITELSEDFSVDLRRRGSDPRSAPKSPAGTPRTAGGRRQKPWELRRSSTPIPGELDASSILHKALRRFSSKVGHSSVKEKEELDE